MDRVGTLPCVVAGASDLGLHLALEILPPDLHQRLETLCHRLIEEEERFVTLARNAAGQVAQIGRAHV